jgi:hypothetical protein
MQAIINLLPGEPGNTSSLNTHPSLLLMTFYYRINDIHHVRALMESGEQRLFRHPARLNRAVELHHHIFECVWPAFDMSAGKWALSATSGFINPGSSLSN